MIRSTTLLALALVTSLAGCSSTLATSAAATATGASAQPFIFGPQGDGSDTTSMGGAGQLGGGGAMGGMASVASAVAGLSLTADQQSQVTAIEAQYAGAAPVPGASPASAATTAGVTALLTADSVDATALRTAIAAQLKTQAGVGSNQVAMWTALYAVLTADQRATLAKTLGATPMGGGTPPAGAPTGTAPSGNPTGTPPAGAPSGTPPAGAPTGGPGGPNQVTLTGLTTVQQAALSAFQAKLTTPAGSAGQSTALAAYFGSGDATTFQTALDTPSTYPTDELVALAAVLTVDQRKQYFANGLPGLGGPGGGMGGPGGQAPSQPSASPS